MQQRQLVEVIDLEKRYNEVVAVDGVSFSVRAGEIFGLLGPNGAGKTTILECLEGLREPDKGHISVLGIDPTKAGRSFRREIGVQLQGARLQPRLKVWEAFDLFAAFYSQVRGWRDLAQRLGLETRLHHQYSKLSGGEQQRLLLGLALIHKPQLLFLDELTTGLDAHIRRSIWDLIREIRSEGQTIILTTHLIEEAERLCDRIAILNKGRLVAVDTPRGIVKSIAPVRKVTVSIEGSDEDAIRSHLQGYRHLEFLGSGRVRFLTDDVRSGREVVAALKAEGLAVSDVSIEDPTLEDAFLLLTEAQLADSRS